jgi:hypothetical protein
LIFEFGGHGGDHPLQFFGLLPREVLRLREVIFQVKQFAAAARNLLLGGELEGAVEGIGEG